MDALASLGGLVVRRHKEGGEILTGFETRNRYSILDVEDFVHFEDNQR